MNKIIVEYYYDFAEIKINDESTIVVVEDLNQIDELLKFISRELNVEIEEINN